MLRETLQSSSAWHQGDGGDVDDDDYVNEKDDDGDPNEKANADDVNEKDGDDDDTAVLKFLAPR